MSLTDRQISVLMDVADVLIPANATMPALRDADATGEWLGRACRARADLVDRLGALLDDLDGADLPAALHALHADDRPAFTIVATFVAGTYYMVPAVRKLIGYPGQVRSPAPLEQAADELSDDIFEGALQYTGTYRHAPV